MSLVIAPSALSDLCARSPYQPQREHPPARVRASGNTHARVTKLAVPHQPASDGSPDVMRGGRVGSPSAASPMCGRRRPTTDVEHDRLG